MTNQTKQTKPNGKPARFRTKADQAYDAKVSEAMHRDDWPRVEALTKDYEAYLRLIEPLCSYENKWTDEVGTIPVCIVHGQNSKMSKGAGPSRPCLAIAPWEVHDPNNCSDCGTSPLDDLQDPVRDPKPEGIRRFLMRTGPKR